MFVTARTLSVIVVLDIISVVMSSRIMVLYDVWTANDWVVYRRFVLFCSQLRSLTTCWIACVPLDVGVFNIFMPSSPPGRWNHYVLDVSVCLFVCPSVSFSVHSVVCYHTREHDILKTNEPVLMPPGTSSPPGKGMIQLTLGVRRSNIKSHGAEIGHKNPFRQVILRAIQRISTKPGRHTLS